MPRGFTVVAQGYTHRSIRTHTPRKHRHTRPRRCSPQSWSEGESKLLPKGRAHNPLREGGTQSIFPFLPRKRGLPLAKGVCGGGSIVHLCLPKKISIERGGNLVHLPLPSPKEVKAIARMKSQCFSPSSRKRWASPTEDPPFGGRGGHLIHLPLPKEWNSLEWKVLLLFWR